MPGLYTGATGLWGGFAGLQYGTSLSTPPGLLADAAGFSPLSLFSGGTSGLWYDPSDIQNYAPLGSQLVTNGTFDSGISGWTNASAAGGSIAWNPAGYLDLIYTTGAATARQQVTVISGREYAVTFDHVASSPSPATVQIFVGTTAGGTNLISLNNVNTGARFSGSFIASGTAAHITLRVVNVGSCSVDNVSLREVTVSGTVTMYQDAAGTTPVTAVGQPVGLILDKSGNAVNAQQTTINSRPVLRQGINGKYYLDFDGTDDFLLTGTLNLAPATAMAVCSGVYRATDANSIYIEGGITIDSGSGKFALRSEVSVDFSYTSRGTSNATAGTSATYTPPTTAVLTGLGDIPNDISILRLNGAQVGQSTADQGTAPNYDSHAYYMGMRAGASLPLNGRIYGMIVVGRSLTTAELANTEAWMNGKTGAY